MLRHTLTIKQRSSRRGWLYSFVFTSRVSGAAILLLLMSFIVQPINQAMAAPESEGEEVSDATAEEVREQTTETADSLEIPEIQNDSIDSIESSFLEDVDEVIDEDVNNDNATPVEEGEDAVTAPDTSDDVEAGGGESDTAATTTVSEGSDTAVSDATTTETSATSTGSTTVVTQAQNLVTDDNFYQFSRQSCIEVGGGTYHCSVSATTEYDTQSVTYAALDGEGDMEIFLRTSRGDVKQITDNQLDDTSPYYDAESLQLVWQRLINDRYQIISYDIASGKESQLTYSRTNSMEPKVSDEGIVWQEWDNNDWEIMYFDGQFTEQITDNVTQDVNPVVQDGYILWSVIGRDAQEAKVYSLESKEILTITGHEGGTIVNPRFVLVYDTKFENGDVITKGFDPVTGLSEPIAATPAPDPVDIPPIDPIGEIRALIQNKSTSEEDQEFDEVPTGDSDVLNLSTTTSTLSTTTLDLKQAVPIVSIPTATTGAIVLSEYDLVIPTTTADTVENAQ
jgi:hypothetical protein